MKLKILTFILYFIATVCGVIKIIADPTRKVSWICTGLMLLCLILQAGTIYLTKKKLEKQNETN